MRDRSIVIIGAGMGGLAAGIHGQSSGYRTAIYEAHTVPGGQAATWTRRGYSFDGCVHHLFGCQPGSRLYELWSEL
ncbi:MAG: NAD(P)-binding protein, partial [Candidatus Bipolaricaulis sp.]|nr:NAD(P)-binding protein [Candidatus Bipolaricaulis sp.]